MNFTYLIFFMCFILISCGDKKEAQSEVSDVLTNHYRKINDEVKKKKENEKRVKQENFKKELLEKNFIPKFQGMKNHLLKHTILSKWLQGDELISLEGLKKNIYSFSFTPSLILFEKPINGKVLWTSDNAPQSLINKKSIINKNNHYIDFKDTNLNELGDYIENYNLIYINHHKKIILKLLPKDSNVDEILKTLDTKISYNGHEIDQFLGFKSSIFFNPANKGNRGKWITYKSKNNKLTAIIYITEKELHPHLYKNVTYDSLEITKFHPDYSFGYLSPGDRVEIKLSGNYRDWTQSSSMKNLEVLSIYGKKLCRIKTFSPLARTYNFQELLEKNKVTFQYAGKNIGYRRIDANKIQIEIPFSNELDYELTMKLKTSDKSLKLKTGLFSDEVSKASGYKMDDIRNVFGFGDYQNSKNKMILKSPEYNLRLNIKKITAIDHLQNFN